jgi:hypothetical protein
MPLIEGTSGTIQVGPTGTPIAVAFIGEWSADCKVEIKKKGPYIGNAAISKVRAGKDCSGSLSGDVPEGQDAGQQDLIDAFNSDADVQMILTATDGYVLTIPLTIVSGVKIGQKAEDGVSIAFDFEANGGFTLAAAA